MASTGSATNVRLIQGDSHIDCPFMPGDGAERLARMLQTDAANAPAPPPPVETPDAP